MKKLTLLAFTCLSVLSYGQDYHKCYTHEAMLQHEENNPGYLNSVNELFNRAKLTSGSEREDVYTIPVVVHIVHNTDEENLPDSVVFNQIAILNADYRRLNEDAENVRDTFNTIVGDTYINFVLASIDPDGNPTTGITRTHTEEASFLNFGALSPAEGVKSTENGGIDPWDQNRYLNIWVCDMSLLESIILLGYATPPDGLPNWPDGSTEGMDDGVVVQYETFGSNNPNPLIAGGGEIDNRGRTLTHEVGHYLGLRHIWADGDCTEEDGIDDTPNADAASESDCDIVKNTCTDAIDILGDLPDMVENYMDYSEQTCQNSFTKGQSQLMRGVLEVERFDLIDDNPALGISKLNDYTNQFSIYPNPSNGSVELSFSSDFLNNKSVSNIEIIGETGQVIRTIKIEKEIKNITIDNLAKGFYMVHLVGSENFEAKKLIIY